MSASQSSGEQSSSSHTSGIEQISDFQLEVEEFESLSERAGSAHDDVVSGFSAAVPYQEEPILDEEWVERYRGKKENERFNLSALQERMSGKIAVTPW